MCKFTLEDMTGNVEAICFTKTYAQYKNAVNEGEIVKIRGRVITDDTGAGTSLQINVQEIETLVA